MSVTRCFVLPGIAEICLDIMKWRQQKALVALRLEAPVFGGAAYGQNA